MLNIKTINTLLILLIIIYLINYLSNNKIINLINKLKNKIENFTISIPFSRQKDFPYINNYNYNMDNFDDNTYYLYNFIDSLIKPNNYYYNLAYNNINMIKADDRLTMKILDYLNIILNSNQFIFNNIKLLNDIYYYESEYGKNIELFKIISETYFKNKYLGKLIFSIELFINNNNLNINIINIKLIGNYSSNKNNNKNKNDNINFVNDKNTFINDDLFDKIFIKTNNSNNNNNNDTDASLIPSIIDISESSQE